MKLRNLGCLVLCLVMALGLCGCGEKIELNGVDLKAALPHAEGAETVSRDGVWQARFHYDGADYEQFGTETLGLIEQLCAAFPETLTYGTDGAEFERYLPKAEGKFHKHLIWVTEDDEVITLYLHRDEEAEQSRLMADVSRETGVLERLDGTITKIDDEGHLFVQVADERFPSEEPILLVWWAGENRLFNPLVPSEDYAVGDEVRMWMRKDFAGDEETERAIHIVKLEAVT